MSGPGREAFRRFRAIARPFWLSEERGIAGGQLALLLLLLVAQTGFSVLYVAQSGEFTSALAARDAERFRTVIVQCLVALALSVPVWALTTYTRDKLALRWRRWLTHRFLDAWLRDRHYYRLNTEGGIDNPDQRIAEDINALTQNSLWFTTIAVGALMQLVAFTGVLWAISPVLVGVLVAYAALGNLVTTGVFARALIGLNFNQIRREADFRFGLVRIREHAEPIALHRGEPFELAQAKRGFAALFANMNAVIRTQLKLGFFQHGFGFFALVLPTIVVAGDVLSGRLEVGRAVEATGAFAAMLSALTIIVSYFTELSRFVAGIERLEGFAAELFPSGAPTAAAPDGPRIETVSAPHLAFEHLTLQTPGRERTLVRDLSLVIEPGAGLAIVGESGVGRTSLLRAIAGLWTAGDGRIARPRPQHVVYVPQQPYLAPGTLRDQILYPESTRDVPDAELLELLERVGLPGLATQAGGLDRERDWAKLLSVGEQQRLAIARLLLAEPHYALLDEATSALDAADEARIHDLLVAAHITPVTVSHRPSLVARHGAVLELATDGGWRLRAAMTAASTATNESTPTTPTTAPNAPPRSGAH